MPTEIDSWIEAGGRKLTLVEHSLGDFEVEAPEDDSWEWNAAEIRYVFPELCKRIKWLSRTQEAATDNARLERENDELAKGILELQRKLTVAEQAHWLYRKQAHWLYRNEVDRRLASAEKRTKYAEDRLQSAVNVGEMWHGRAQKATEAAVHARLSAEHFLPVVPFPAGEDPEARWGLTELGERVLAINREGKAWRWTEKGWETSWDLSYDLAAVCTRCGRPYREHLEGPECDGFLASTEDEKKRAWDFLTSPERITELVAAGPLFPEGLRFVCGACMEAKPLVDRAPSTMPLCNQCWRKDP